MTNMVPAQTLSNQQYYHHLFHGYGGAFASFPQVMSRVQGYDECLGSDLADNNNTNNNNKNISMAEDDSRTNSLNEAAGSSTRDNTSNIIPNTVREDSIRDDDPGWLQLSIGRQTTTYEANKRADQTAGTSVSAPAPVELDLLPSPNNSQQLITPLAPFFNSLQPEYNPPPVIFQQQQNQASSSSMFFPHHHHQENISWVFRPLLQNTGSVSSSSSSSMMPVMRSYFSRPFQLQMGIVDGAGSTTDFRVIDPPRRPHSGIWFVLQASQNQ